jgi:hypothetical protein
MHFNFAIGTMDQQATALVQWNSLSKRIWC